ncbi:SDR family NAD(P)-dependent oxidoreductase [Massilia niabensis]|uniref:SDR family NAD(P)-dependent oxidoreductase n=1 Tax=Massilia niabensis TaxID=544910 RepID=A0ABW0LDY2_9BURK
MLRANLAGRTALVTGASSGFGAHFAHVLAGAGAHVVVAARRVDALEQLVGEIQDKGQTAQAMALDVTDSAKVDEAIGSLKAVDILVNNAGVTLSKPFAAQTPEDWDFVIDTNLRGAALVAMAVARKMKGNGSGGTIINIASILGVRQGGQLSAYAVSKAGVIQLTKSMALDLARDRIRVNALAPGYFDTELNHDFFQSDAGQALVKRVPFRRLGQLEDLDGPLLLLATDASSYMTGAVIAVDGGHLVSSL